jgi:hypothetical protein
MRKKRPDERRPDDDVKVSRSLLESILADKDSTCERCQARKDGRKVLDIYLIEWEPGKKETYELHILCAECEKGITQFIHKVKGL